MWQGPENKERHSVDNKGCYQYAYDSKTVNIFKNNCNGVETSEKLTENMDKSQNQQNNNYAFSVNGRTNSKQYLCAYMDSTCLTEKLGT